RPLLVTALGNADFVFHAGLQSAFQGRAADVLTVDFDVAIVRLWGELDFDEAVRGSRVGGRGLLPQDCRAETRVAADLVDRRLHGRKIPVATLRLAETRLFVRLRPLDSVGKYDFTRLDIQNTSPKLTSDHGVLGLYPVAFERLGLLAD